MESTTSTIAPEQTQQCAMPVPQSEHNWLHRLVGEWSVEGECSMGPDEPPQKFHGHETVRSIGGLWTLAEGTGDMPDGSPMTTITTLGYDPAKQRFTGTFIGSMMTHLWTYSGALDPDGRVLTLETEGPDFEAGGAIAKMRDIIEFIGDNQRILRSEKLGADGRYQEFMRATYTRT